MSSLAEDVLEMVRIPSLSGEEGPLADLLERRLAGAAAEGGYQTLRLENSLLLRSRVDDPRPHIVFAGHLDTVPRGEAAEPAIIAGRVVGRGSADMKGGVAVMLRLAEEVPAASGFARRSFVFYTGEEGGAAGNSLPRVLDAHPELKSAGLAIVCEPTGGELELGCNGSIHVEIVFSGKACHSARPWAGLHPLVPALPWLEQIVRHPIRAVEIEGAVFREVASLTCLEAASAKNVVPGSLLVNLNVRYAPDRDPGEAERFAISLCPPKEIAESRIVDHSPAGRVDSGSPLLRHVWESTGLPRRAKQGWTDVARFSALGIPALNWGPGNPELAHTRDEHLEIEGAQRCLDTIKAFLLGSGPAA